MTKAMARIETGAAVGCKLTYRRQFAASDDTVLRELKEDLLTTPVIQVPRCAYLAGDLMASPNIASISSVLSQCGFDETECAQIMDTLFLRLEQSTREPPNDTTATQVFLHCVGESQPVVPRSEGRGPYGGPLGRRAGAW